MSAKMRKLLAGVATDQPCTIQELILHRDGEELERVWMPSLVKAAAIFTKYDLDPSYTIATIGRAAAGTHTVMIDIPVFREHLKGLGL